MKKTKGIKKTKNTRSALRVEALESRQLLAGIVGGEGNGGVSVANAQDVLLNGNKYDQVLMTGANLTVQADPSQIVRVSFLDLGGDIVQAEFSGAGQLSVSMDSGSFNGSAVPTKYNQSGVTYVQGLASFTIQGADATTNFAVFSVGSGNAVNKALFDTTHTGDNNTADVARLTIVANPNNPNGSTFGSIFAGNAVFSDSKGTVGIAATNVQVQNGVVVGDVDAKDAATPYLVFGSASQFGAIRVAGGDLVQTNGNAINNNNATAQVGFYAYDISFIDGQTSAGVLDRAEVLQPSVTFNAATGFISTFDTATSYDLTGKSQTDITSFFTGRTFTKDFTVTGDLLAGFEIKAAAFKGNLTFAGKVDGNVTLDDINNTVQPSAAFGGTLTFKENVGGTIMAERFGSVTFDKNLSGMLTTIVDGPGASIKGGIGNVTIGGNLSGSILSALDIGNVSVTGNVTTGAGSVIATQGASASELGNVGNLTVKGYVDLGAATQNLIDIQGTGAFGNVSIEGKSSPNASNNAALNVGVLNVAALGAGQTKVGTVSIVSDNTSLTQTPLNFGGVVLGGAGTIGAVSITGNGGDFILSGSIGGTDDAVTSLSVTKFDDLTVGAAQNAKTIGNLTLSTITGTMSDNATIAINAQIGANNTGSSIGTVLIDAGKSDSGVTFAADLASATIGDIGITAAGTTFNSGFGIVSGTKTGAISVTGNAVFAGGSNISVKDAASLSVSGTSSLTNTTGATAADSNILVTGKMGDVSFNGTTTIAATNGSVLWSAAGSVQNLLFTNTTATSGAFNAVRTGSVASVTFAGDTTLSGTGGTFLMADNDGSGVDTVGSLTFNGKVVGRAAGAVDFQASKFGDITVKAAIDGAGQTIVTDLNVLAANNGDATAAMSETVARDGSNLADYSIGNIWIEDTQTLGYASSALFAGTSSIQALGSLGNINLVAGGTETVQTRLFQAGADTATFVAGQVWAGVDFDGNGVVGMVTDAMASGFTDTQETNADFSAGSVAIGNVTINASRVAVANADTIENSDGLRILSGVEAAGTPATYNAGIDDPGLRSPDAGDGIDGATVGTLTGNIGNILITNKSQVLTVSQSDTDVDATDDNPAQTAWTTGDTFTSALIAASGKIGTVQGQFSGSTSANILDADGEYVIVGQDTGDGDVANGAQNEVLIFVV